MTDKLEISSPKQHYSPCRNIINHMSSDKHPMSQPKWREVRGQEGSSWTALGIPDVRRSSKRLLPEASPPLSHVNYYYITPSFFSPSSSFLAITYLCSSTPSSQTKTTSIFPLILTLSCIYYRSYPSLSCRFDCDCLWSTRFGLAAICYLLTNASITKLPLDNPTLCPSPLLSVFIP
ncbi:hypothetical protein P168DRAFT_176170 [Aspergillus campestris IBT 28561]|uniref:Uncharacterized protein n=1 Tax=Aspergillus campestris (strain IBT 28561) TaxID=1392248 RepID=A0A2I1CZK2_ASPC2|nr:uncharacterized protein P168DRAFT_176170 [Aspergillus campestris IBT 28561]PKY03054.1 hypothetical protein P168DRAFT_176170 [Aspergillus campestris IBT 28561]